MEELLTALAVSVDAYFAGLSYAITTKVNAKSVICVLFITFLCCVLALALSAILVAYAYVFRVAGGVVFIGLGVRNLFERKETQVFSSVWVLGLGVSMDAALACLTLAVSPSRILFLALLFAFFHALFSALGFFCARFARAARFLTVTAGIGLIVLGVKKFF